MKPYIRLNAYELGQVMGAMGTNIAKLTPRLHKKVKRAVERIYQDGNRPKA